MRNRARFLVPLMVAGLVAAGCSSGGASPAGQGPGAASAPAADPANPNSLPRNETLYTSGTQWGPPANFNPIREWDSATGTKGLAYETLFHFDPNAGKLTPWLAESGSWTDDTTYRSSSARVSPGPTSSRSRPRTWSSPSSSAR